MSARRLLAVLSVPLALAAAACTSGKATEDHATGSASRGGGHPSPPTSVGTTPGSYRFANGGITATVKLEGSSGTLEIENDTGRTLARPDLYVLDARDGSRIEVRVDGAAPIRDGDKVSLAIALQRQIELKNIGWVDLLIGGDDYGGFVQQ